jgi:hypothetical protein
MHLLFLTTNNVATNPRLAKELKTAIELDATVSAVQFNLGNWSDNKSDELIKRFNEDLPLTTIVK